MLKAIDIRFNLLVAQALLWISDRTNKLAQKIILDLKGRVDKLRDENNAPIS